MPLHYGEKARALESDFVAAPSVDLSHHLSKLSKGRASSPLKDIFKYITMPGMVAMAGGLPAPDYFPFESIAAQALVPDAFSVDTNGSGNPGVFDWLWKFFGSSPPTKTMVVPKYEDDPNAIQLSTALQYSGASGQLALQKFVQEFSTTVFKPLSNMQTFIHAGNTDAWAKCFGMLCNPGELILTEEWAYVSALAAAKPHGINPIGVPMDGEGMRADALEEMLTNWDTEARGAARPHVMYTVPVGQNPCGTNMSAERKKSIYDICVEFDIIIVEDDPYYFLQVGEYTPPVARTARGKDEKTQFLDSLIPSYLRFDYQGRVVRLDTFSKTIAPGSRLGWYTACPLFIERLERDTETSTQAPCGFSQALITQLITKHWGYSGWIRWLRGIKAQYTIRRDVMIDALGDVFDLEDQYKGGFTPLSGCVGIIVGRSKQYCSKEKKSKVLFTFVAPTAGMFIWVKVHLYNHPAYDPNAPLPTTPEESLEYRLWEDFAKSGILLAPGWFFGTDPDATLIHEIVETARLPTGDQYRALSEGGKYGHLRISFSSPTKRDLAVGLSRMAQVFDKHFFPA